MDKEEKSMNMVTVDMEAFDKAKKKFKTASTMARAIGKDDTYIYKIKKFGKCSEDAALKIEEITGVNIVLDIKPRTRKKKHEFTETYEQTSLFSIVDASEHIEKSLHIWGEKIIEATESLMRSLEGKG